MIILFLNSIGKKKYGGGEKWMIRASQELGKRGHNVYFGAKNGSVLLQKAADAGVQTWGIDIHADLSPIATIKIVKFLKDKHIDVLICNLNKDVRVGGLAARIAKTSLVLARHGMLLCGKKFKHKLTLTHLTDGIITNTISIKDTYGTYGWFADDFVKVIYNGVELAENVEPVNWQTMYPQKKIVLSAGRLADQKGFDYLIQAAASICKIRNDIVFLIVGEGKLENDLQTMIRDYGLENNVHLIGFRADIKPLIMGSDLFVLASRFEGMPNVVMEAMSVGKAVVATDVNGARELMEDGVSGQIVPPHNPEAISDAILKIIDNPTILDSMGRRGQETVRSKFTYDIMADNLEMHLLELLDRQKKPKQGRVVSSKFLSRKLKRWSLTLLSELFFSRIKQEPVAIPDKLDTIAIFVQEKLGDALLLTPLIRFLSTHFPGIRITLLTFSKATYSFFKNDPFVYECFYINLAKLPLLSNLAKRGYDLLYNPKDHPSNTFLLLTALIKARYKVAVYHDLHQGFYHKLLEVDFGEHVIRKNLSLATLWDKAIDLDDMIPYLPTRQISHTMQVFADSLQSKPVAFNLSAGESHRLWDEQNWVRLAELISERIVILAMPGERELKRALEKRFAHVIVSPTTTNLAEASLLLSKCLVLITPDTSLVHLSMISDTPVIGLYRFDPVHHMRFAPLSRNSRKLVSTSHTICDITPDEVYLAYQEVLGETKG